MHEAFPLERWAEMRALYEGAPPNHDRLSIIAGLNPGTVRARSSLDNWPRRVFIKANNAWKAGDCERAALELYRISTGQPDAVLSEPLNPPPPLDSAESVGGKGESGRAERVSAMLLNHADRLIEQVERQGGVLTKPQLDAMLGMVRLSEKFEPLAAREMALRQTRSDDEIAEILNRISQRIIEHGEEHGRRLAAGTYDGGTCSVCGR